MGVILLVRHGQASFGTDDYDRLSEEGVEQSRILGDELRSRRIEPAVVVRGDMVRHRQTAEGAGYGDADVDADWNEFDHLKVLAAHTPPDSSEAPTERRAFQAWFEEGTKRWMSGDFDTEYEESYAAFTTRVADALDRVVQRIASNETAVAFTSGGVIAAVACRLLGADSGIWQSLNRVTVNGSITKLVVGRGGVTLVSFNDHVHLEPGHVTYR
ncbi:MAG: histidine phosphatase family protein [Nocardioidaceae bacterium]